MNNIKEIEFTKIDKESLFQGGLVTIRDSIDHKAAQEYNTIKEIDEERTKDSGVIYEGTSKSLEELLKANSIAYTILERSVVIKVMKLPQTIFTIISFGILVFGLTILSIYLFKNIYILNPFISLLIIIVALGWFITGILSFKSGNK